MPLSHKKLVVFAFTEVDLLAQVEEPLVKASDRWFRDGWSIEECPPLVPLQMRD